jgi:hypothetical protein
MKSGLFIIEILRHREDYLSPREADEGDELIEEDDLDTLLPRMAVLAAQAI